MDAKHDQTRYAVEELSNAAASPNQAQRDLEALQHAGHVQHMWHNRSTRGILFEGPSDGLAID
eukprot:1828359-Pyramimonas_sp.AAC.1